DAVGGEGNGPSDAWAARYGIPRRGAAGPDASGPFTAQLGPVAVLAGVRRQAETRRQTSVGGRQSVRPLDQQHHAVVSRHRVGAMIVLVKVLPRTGCRADRSVP